MSQPHTPGPYGQGAYGPGQPQPRGHAYASGGGYPPGGYQPGGYPQGGGYQPGGYPQGGYPQGGGYPRGGGHQGGGYPPGGGRPGRSVPQGPHPAEDLPLAPLGRRAAARALETGLLWVLGVAVIVPFVLAILGGREPAQTGETGQAEQAGTPTSAIYFTFFIVLVVIPFIYEWVQLAFRGGQTFGKAYFGLRVVDADPPGETISMITAAKRAAVNNAVYWFGCGIGVLIGYLWGIWDKPLHQCMHDKLAGTVVIDERVEYEDSSDDVATGVFDTYTE